MKFNEPITEEGHEKADREHRELAERQKKQLMELAKKIEDGQPLDKYETGRAVGAIRIAADRINPVRKRPAGKPSKIRDDARLVYAVMRLDGVSKNKAVERIAEMYEVSTTAVKKKLGLTGSSPEREINKDQTDQAFLMAGGEPET